MVVSGTRNMQDLPTPKLQACTERVMGLSLVHLIFNPPLLAFRRLRAQKKKKISAIV